MIFEEINWDVLAEGKKQKSHETNNSIYALDRVHLE